MSDLVDAIESDILAGRIEPGTALPGERQLAARHNVGRPLVREAIRSLAARGMLDIQPGRGTFVVVGTSLGRFDATELSTRATPRQIAESRIILEGQAARLAAERATPADIELLESFLLEIDHTTDPVARARLDVAFHLTLARASGNPVIEAMLASVAPLMVKLMLSSIGDGRTADASYPMHRRCLDAVRDGDPDRAQAEMVAHLTAAADRAPTSGYDEPLDITNSVYARDLVGDYGSVDRLVEAVLSPQARRAARSTAAGTGAEPEAASPTNATR